MHKPIPWDPAWRRLKDDGLITQEQYAHIAVAQQTAVVAQMKMHVDAVNKQIAVVEMASKIVSENVNKGKFGGKPG